MQQPFFFFYNKQKCNNLFIFIFILKKKKIFFRTREFKISLTVFFWHRTQTKTFFYIVGKEISATHTFCLIASETTPNFCVKVESSAFCFPVGSRLYAEPINKHNTHTHTHIAWFRFFFFFFLFPTIEHTDCTYEN